MIHKNIYIFILLCQFSCMCNSWELKYNDLDLDNEIGYERTDEGIEVYKNFICYRSTQICGERIYLKKLNNKFRVFDLQKDCRCPEEYPICRTAQHPNKNELRDLKYLDTRTYDKTCFLN